ncbi:hypothetical protein LTR16_002407 [Cryomyces antarcticus]|uniref:Uncharacterized protein n=1 Tax=Cryomyces antarcticus TaxID=329879 RepID=A0ABR0KV58_9PEZI|nr:hypothetical protein LTR60_002125 [Cryomyces antarcticus]KAK5129137.1 hypothetical protein LTR16_002407 [Cryomyces antarcticus]
MDRDRRYVPTLDSCTTRAPHNTRNLRFDGAHPKHNAQIPLRPLFPTSTSVRWTGSYGADHHTNRNFRDPDQYKDGRGQSYRPGASGRSPPPRPGDSYRAARSPPRGPPLVDSYAPGKLSARPRSRSPPPFRRRSRSPGPSFRGGRDNGGWRGRPRSPPRRDFSPPRGEGFRRDVRQRSPPAQDFRTARSPPPRARERSPLPLKRSREVSPVGSRGRRSPPPAKRERLASPPRGRYDPFPSSRGQSPPRRDFSAPPRERRPTPPRGVTRDYRLHSRSPLQRNERIDPVAVNSWRRRSPSPKPLHIDLSADNSGRESRVSSRRSSPPIHPSRLALQGGDERPTRPPPAATYPPRPRSPYRAKSPVPLSPPRRRESPPPRDRGYDTNGDGRGPPSRPVYRNGDSARPPPTGPGGQRNYLSAKSPPAGPAPAPTSMSAHNRQGSVLSAPSQPRGGGGGRGSFSREYPRDFSRDYPGPPQHPPRRGSGHWPPRGGRGGPPPYDREYSNSGPPTGPRGSFGASERAPPGPPFRGSLNSTSTTYPRTQRFSAQAPPSSSASRHLDDLPPIIPGGQKAAEPFDNTKLLKLEEEAKRLREIIAERQAKKRQGLREWEKLERESGTAALRSELAEGGLRALNGEGELGGAAF